MPCTPGGEPLASVGLLWRLTRTLCPYFQSPVPGCPPASPYTPPPPPPPPASSPPLPSTLPSGAWPSDPGRAADLPTSAPLYSLVPTQPKGARPTGARTQRLSVRHIQAPDKTPGGGWKVRTSGSVWPGVAQYALPVSARWPCGPTLLSTGSGESRPLLSPHSPSSPPPRVSTCVQTHVMGPSALFSRPTQPCVPGVLSQGSRGADHHGPFRQVRARGAASIYGKPQ